MTAGRPARRWWHAVAAAAALAVVVGPVLVVPSPAHADEVRDAQWHLEFLDVARAHRISQGAGVTVAVIDTGVDAGHRDLAGAVLRGTDVTASPAGDGDGRTDLDGHGTGMAGLIAARGHGSGDGALGVAPRARVLPIRFREFGGVGAITGTAGAINWAVTHGARVISMSFGTAEPDEETRAAVEAALADDVVVVASVGNAPLAQAVEYPAAYPGVLAVGGVDRRGQRADVSVTGPQVQIAAPAVDLVSTDRRGETGYQRSTGTSDATAIVAGAAALVRARYPDLSAAEVAHRLTATARDAGTPGRDDEYGFGVLDPVAALTADVPPLAGPTATPTGQPVPTAPPGPGTASGEDDGGVPVALVLAGLACMLALALAAGLVAWLLLRRRSA